MNPVKLDEVLDLQLANIRNVRSGFRALAIATRILIIVVACILAIVAYNAGASTLAIAAIAGGWLLDLVRDRHHEHLDDALACSERLLAPLPPEQQATYRKLASPSQINRPLRGIDLDCIP